MKKILILFVMLSFIFASAQYNNGTVFFKDNTFSKGLIKIKSFGGIKFKSDKNSEAVYYDYNQINGFDVKGKRYKYVKYNDNLTPRLFNERIKGKIMLYSNEVYNPGHMVPNSGGISFGGGTSTIYFIKVKNKLIRIGSKIKKKHIKIFNNCPSLIQKIEKKELKKIHVYKIIAYYNNNCK